MSGPAPTLVPFAELSGRDLVEQALADPVSLLEWYADELAGAAPVRAVELLRAAGVAAREQRDLELSETLLLQARDRAEPLGDRRLIALVDVSLAATVLYRGDADGATELIARAVADLDGDDLFLAQCQRAGILHRAGRVAEALAAFDEAFAAAGPEPSTAIAEAHNNRGILLGYLDRNVEATTDIERARALFAQLGYERRVVDMTHNLGWLAGRRGELVSALSLFDEAEIGYAALGLPSDAVLPDRCEVLLAAGLATEALDVASRAAASLEAKGDRADLAEALVTCAQIALRVHDAPRAREAATRAAELLAASGRTPWAAHATALMIEADHQLHPVDAESLERLGRAREALVGGDLAQAVHEADLLRGRILLALGHVDAASAAVDAADTRRLPVHLRPAARALRARVRDARGDQRGAWRELRRGAAELSVVRERLGATELRASIGLHAEDVLQVGLELALRVGRPALVLEWSDRGRARSLHHPRVAPMPDEVIGSLERVRRLHRAATGGAPVDAAELDRAVTELRRASRRRGADGMGDQPVVRVGELRAALGQGCLVQLVDDGDWMWAVVVDRARTRLVRSAPTADWLAAGDHLRRAVARVLSGRGDERLRAAARDVLRSAAERLDGLVAPVLDIARAAADAEVVLVPTAPLHAVPWGALASLADRCWTQAPSASMWLAAIRRPDTRLDSGPGSAVFAGPGLDGALEEVALIRGLSAADDGEPLLGRAADMAGVLAQHAVVHLACHGRFVADNPLLSSLELDDGRWYAHDVELAARCPSVVVLSACSVALAAPQPGDELLGFVASLLGAGTRTVVASSVPVPDAAGSAEAMVELHRQLGAGGGAAAALRAVRRRWPVLGAAYGVHGAGR